MQINDAEIVAEVRAAFDGYEIALCANDLAMLRELFWASPLTLRYGPRENLYGADAIHAFRAGRPAIQRPRDLLRVIISTFGRDAATANAEFMMPGDARLGRQSQTWIRTPNGWRIVAAHVSYEEP
ncbi:oxalurate catabolism protein HpxZ [Hansschlegelia quercus]|uniref:Oxalurate catabolism protein HpxZ n=1 Tax=Hansschlegelia quercus TaxID=2528245 RepID=A0A4Q9GHE8_9HYPH|nr:oxalurate catabolism protein HpxZ [Hansschlegelia quercus]TBN53599.1 oxalurate catabolism protein HpxZ [Hansschlegelia quercus]